MNVSGITFISYANNQKVGKPNNLSVFVSKLTKEPKQDNQNRPPNSFFYYLFGSEAFAISLH
jgi:hypothetical protein